MTQHLWEINHPYYCSESNYFANGIKNRELNQTFNDFDEFLAEWGDADFTNYCANITKLSESIHV